MLACVWEGLLLVQVFGFGQFMGLHVSDGRRNTNSYLFISLLVCSTNHILHVISFVY
jgi:hypothetical protein